MDHLLISETSEALADQVAEHFAKTVQEILTHQENCAVALSGGSTPRTFLSRLAESPYPSMIDWSRLHFFWGDERWVRPNHKDSNFRMAWEALLSRVPVPKDRIYRMPTDEGNPLQAAARYEAVLRRFFGELPGFPRLDLVFLGLGADGHTASLFSKSSALAEKARWVVATKTPEGVPRLTLTIPMFNHARNIFFVVEGREKASALEKVLDGGPGSYDLPAKMIQPADGSLLWFADRSAISLTTPTRVNEMRIHGERDI